MQTTDTKPRNTILLAAITVAVVVAGIFAFRAFTRERVGIHAASVTYQNLLSSVSANGKVEPVGEYQAHAPAPSVVKQVYVEVGDKVKAGTLVVSLDDTDARARIATATSNLRTAESTFQDITHGGTQDERLAMSAEIDRDRSQVAQAQRELETNQRLQQNGAVSAGEVAGSQQRLQTTQSALAAAERRSTGRYGASDLSRSTAQIADARAQLAAARNTYASYNIRTPISGTVYAVPVSEYDFVKDGDDLLDIAADLDHVQIRAYFDEADVARLQQGQTVEITWEAKPGRVWHGHIERAPTTATPFGTRSVGECVATVDDAHGDLLPNTNVNVKVTTSRRMNALSVPREALHADAGNYVYRIIDQRLVRTPIKVGPATNLTRVEVLSGLTDKDIVALNPTTNRDLSDGLEVKIVQ